MPSKLAEQLPIFSIRTLERGEERAIQRCPGFPFKGPIVERGHVIRSGARKDALFPEVGEGGEIVEVCTVDLKSL